MTAGKTAFGVSSPARPVLQRPEPLSITTAGFDIKNQDVVTGKDICRKLHWVQQILLIEMGVEVVGVL